MSTLTDERLLVQAASSETFRNTINDHYSKRLSDQKSVLTQLSMFQDEEDANAWFKVQRGVEDFQFLVWADDPECEVQLKVIGMVVGTTGIIPSNVNEHVIHRTHAISLIAPRTQEFQTAYQAQRTIYDLFASAVEENLEPHRELLFNNEFMIQGTTKYATPLSKTGFPQCPVPAMLDNKARLKRLVNNGRVRFTEENLVGFKRLKNGNLLNIKPDQVALGSLAEITLQFRAIPSPKGFKVLTRLDECVVLTDATCKLYSSLRNHDSSTRWIPKRRREDNSVTEEEARRIHLQGPFKSTPQSTGNRGDEPTTEETIEDRNSTNNSEGNCTQHQNPNTSLDRDMSFSTEPQVAVESSRSIHEPLADHWTESGFPAMDI